ncbi:MAG: hypothetical protein E7324_05270 [Clostridiales bacterium]|nr:hypothetical protein [Clostridiales bacterium]
MKVITILALVFAALATIAAFIFIVPAKKRAILNKFWQFVHDTLNFRYLIVEKILQAVYIFATAYVILMGFFMLFYVESGYYSSYWFGGYGLLLMLLGPIVVRLIYEFTMMMVLLVKNVIQINKKLKAADDTKDDTFGMNINFKRRSAAPKAPVQEQPEYRPYQPGPQSNDF